MQVIEQPNGGGGKLKQYLKPPYLYFILAGAGLGVYALIKNKGSDTSSEPVYVPNTSASNGTETTDETTGLTELIQSLSESENAHYTDIQLQLNEQKNATNTAISQINASAGNLTAQTQQNADSITRIADVVSSNARAAASSDNDIEYQNQISAATNIRSLQTLYATEKNSFLEDGVINADEKAQLDNIHNQAQTISQSAGFGIGSADGTGRNISNDVVKKTGVVN